MELPNRLAQGHVKTMARQDMEASRFQLQGLRIVRAYVDSKLDKSDPPVEYSVYVVWFSKTLQNWKGLFSTTLHDQMYYEVTHDGENLRSYLDAYKKFENVVIEDDLELE